MTEKEGKLAVLLTFLVGFGVFAAKQSAGERVKPTGRPLAAHLNHKVI